MNISIKSVLNLFKFVVFRDLQFYTESGFRGGPIIMVQIENEYGNYGYIDYPRDKACLADSST